MTAPGASARTNPARAATALAALLSLGACASGPAWRAPELWTPPAWPQRIPLAGLREDLPPDPAWWSGFGDPVLTGLVAQAASRSLAVQDAAARIRAARALQGGRGGQPDVAAGADVQRARLSGTGPLRLLERPGEGLPVRGRDGFDLFRAGFDASWELDLWGRAARAAEAADAGLDASRDARRDALVSVQAEIARSYIGLRVAQAARQATAQAIAAARPPRRAAAWDTLRRARLEAALPQFELDAMLAANRIALLLAEPSGALDPVLLPSGPVPQRDGDVSVGLPSELARRRPDIRAAEARLHAATAAVGVAEASFFPRITLSGSLALQALQLRDLGNWGSLAYAAGPGVSLPVFDGGRLRAMLELSRADQQQAAIAYQRTVLQAFHEVDAALLAWSAERRRLAALGRAVAAARVLARLPAGAPGHAAAQEAEWQAEIDRIDGQGRLAIAWVRLHTALGGGWEADFPLPARPATPSAPPKDPP